MTHEASGLRTLTSADFAEMRAIESLVVTRVEGAPLILQPSVDPFVAGLRTKRTLGYVLRPEEHRIGVCRMPETTIISNSRWHSRIRWGR